MKSTYEREMEDPEFARKFQIEYEKEDDEIESLEYLPSIIEILKDISFFDWIIIFLSSLIVAVILTIILTI